MEHNILPRPKGEPMKYALGLLSIALLLAACASPIPPPTPSATPAPPTLSLVEISVYFTDRALFNAGTPPFERAVMRQVPVTSNLAEAVLTEYFKGPTPEEAAQGLEAITSGFTGFSRLEVVDGTAHVYLVGTCSTGGAAYNIATPLIRNLTQFPEVQYVKIYDENGQTGDPSGVGNSIPACLEP